MTALSMALLELVLTLNMVHGPGMRADATRFMDMTQGIAHASTVHDPCLAVPPVVVSQRAIKRAHVGRAKRLLDHTAWDTRMSVEARCAYEAAGYRKSLYRARAYQNDVTRDVTRAQTALGFH
jgi:hypothetical protein